MLLAGGGGPRCRRSDAGSGAPERPGPHSGMEEPPRPGDRGDEGGPIIIDISSTFMIIHISIIMCSINIIKIDIDSNIIINIDNKAGPGARSPGPTAASRSGRGRTRAAASPWCQETSSRTCCPPM